MEAKTQMISSGVIPMKIVIYCTPTEAMNTMLMFKEILEGNHKIEPARLTLSNKKFMATLYNSFMETYWKAQRISVNVSDSEYITVDHTI